MTQNPLTVTPQDTLAITREKMEKGHCRHLPVVENDIVVGIVTESDFRRQEGVQERTRVVAAMTENPLSVSPSAPIEEAIQLMLWHQVRGLPVLESSTLVGILTASNVLQAFFYNGSYR